MKVKLYKGPLHGKTYDVDPNQLHYGLRFSVLKGVDLLTDTGFAKSHIARYEMRIMGARIGGREYGAPAIHPDGSIYLVYAGD